MITRETMQGWGEQIAQLESLKPYLENNWLKLIVDTATSDSCFVILCGNMYKSQFYPSHVKAFVEDFRRDLIYHPATFVPDVLRIIANGIGKEIRHRQWPSGASDYDDHWDFGWSITIWTDEGTFAKSIPPLLHIKEAKHD